MCDLQTEAMANALLAAAGQNGGSGSPGLALLVNLLPFLIILLVMYAVLFRPQQIRMKKHAEMLKTLKPRDRVVTSAGIVGEVITVREHTVTVRSADAKLEVLKSSISEILERGSDAKDRTNQN